MKKPNLKNSIISLLLVVVLLIILETGCSLLPKASTPLPGTTPPSVEISPSSPSAAQNTTPTESKGTAQTVTNPAPVLPSIADVVAQVKPSVVAITTEIATFDFFNRPITEEGAGSGWILNENGIVVTNNHVVENANNITVTLNDGRTFTVDSKSVFTDQLGDLAVLKINAQNLPALKIGDSAKLRVGDWVVAMGNSLGLGISATKGIVSAMGVSVTASAGQTLYDLIQTDAAINPGNSGGPLVNMAGEVVGISSVKIAQIGIEGMGYAISTKEALPIIEQLLKNGYVVRPWLGVTLSTVNQITVLRYNLAVDKGALIAYIAPGSPADKAGLRTGDVITRFGDKEITTVDDIIRTIRSSRVGQKVEITFWRSDTEKTTYATLVESPPPS